MRSTHCTESIERALVKGIGACGDAKVSHLLLLADGDQKRSTCFDAPHRCAPARSRTSTLFMSQLSGALDSRVALTPVRVLG